MAISPSAFPPIPVGMFDYAVDWQINVGNGQPVADEQYVKVMYSNGFVASMVRPAYAWVHWTGGRNWWLRPDDDRLWIMMYTTV